MRTEEFAKPTLLIILLAGSALMTGGCVSPHGGPVVPGWMDRAMATKPARIEGVDGTSPETALRISTVDKRFLASDEDSWVHERYWSSLTPPRTWEEFGKSVKRETKRNGTSVYDIVTLTLPNGETRTTYFDVTKQRFYWPREQ